MDILLLALATAVAWLPGIAVLLVLRRPGSLAAGEGPWIAGAGYLVGAFALTLWMRALSRLEADAADKNRQQQFATLKPYLTGDEPQLSYAAAAATLGLSEGAVKVAVHRLRRQFRDVVRDEIAQTVDSPAQIEDELRHLRSALLPGR